MPAWAEWTGWVIAVVLGIANAMQYIKALLRKRTRDAEYGHIVAVKHSLCQLRAMCTEAIELGEIIKTEPSKQWVRQMAHSIRNIEHHIDATLKTLSPTKSGHPNSKVDSSPQQPSPE